MQVMVWKTNFDRHLDDYILTHVHKGDTQLQHETTTFPPPPNAAPATAQPVPAARPGATKEARATAHAGVMPDEQAATIAAVPARAGHLDSAPMPTAVPEPAGHVEVRVRLMM